MKRALDRIDGINDHHLVQYIINLKKHLDKWEKENPPSTTNLQPTINTPSEDKSEEESVTKNDSEESQPTTTGNVLITNLVYKGEVKQAQSDEYIEITNLGSAPVNLYNWKVTSGKKEFSFPVGTMLAAGQSFRVYTNEVKPEFGGFSFGSSGAIWRDKGGEGKLLDAEGKVVSNWVYDDQGNVTGKNRKNGASTEEEYVPDF